MIFRLILLLLIPTLVFADAAIFSGSTVKLLKPLNSGTATAGQILTANGSGSSSWVTTTDPLFAQNYSLTTSVAANAMTIALKDASGADASATSPAKFAFRNATAATGTYSVVSVTGALSMTITSGATLGHQDNVLQYIYVALINNSGTAELAVIGSRYDLDEGGVISTTIMNSSSDDYLTMYSTTARSNVAFRIIGRLSSTQTTAGTYASNASQISLGGVHQWPDSSSWKSDLTWTVSGFTASALNVYYKRNQGSMVVRGYFTNTAVAASTAYIQLPSGYTIDTSTNMFSSTADLQIVGQGHLSEGGGPFSVWNNNFGNIWFFDGSTTNRIFISYQTNSTTTFVKNNGNALANAYDTITFNFEIPIARWRSY